MSSADVSFARVNDAVVMELSIQGRTVIRTTSQESVVRELQMLGVRELKIEEKFVTELPTSSKCLAAAALVPFGELMAVLKLIAACASIEEIWPLPVPERRTRPQAEKPHARFVH